MKLNKLKTFSSLSQKKKVSTDGRTMVLKADRSLFGRIIIIGQSRKIDVRELLQYSLGPLPWSLATTEKQTKQRQRLPLSLFHLLSLLLLMFLFDLL